MTFHGTYTGITHAEPIITLIFLLINAGLDCCRYTMYPWILPRLARNASQLLFVGTFAISFATIASGTALIAVPRFGQWARDLTWALWWIGILITLAIVLGVPVRPAERIILLPLISRCIWRQMGGPS